MRRTPPRKRSIRTPAPPGFVVSGVRKVGGLGRSVDSFERVQMWSGRVALNGGRKGKAIEPSYCPALTPAEIGLGVTIGYLNAFKWAWIEWTSPSGIGAPDTGFGILASGPDVPTDARAGRPRRLSEHGRPGCRESRIAQSPDPLPSTRPWATLLLYRSAVETGSSYLPAPADTAALCAADTGRLHPTFDNNLRLEGAAECVARRVTHARVSEIGSGEDRARARSPRTWPNQRSLNHLPCYPGGWLAKRQLPEMTERTDVRNEVETRGLIWAPSVGLAVRFERVQMTTLAHTHSQAGSNRRPAEIPSHTCEGGTPMNRAQ